MYFNQFLYHLSYALVEEGWRQQAAYGTGLRPGPEAAQAPGCGRDRRRRGHLATRAKPYGSSSLTRSASSSGSVTPQASRYAPTPPYMSNTLS